jgi:hypothetical protein
MLLNRSNTSSPTESNSENLTEYGLLLPSARGSGDARLAAANIRDVAAMPESNAAGAGLLEGGDVRG